MQIQSEIYIHAASAAVWAVVSRLDEWPTWHPQVLAAAWSDGAPWAEGSRMRLRLRSPIGLPVTNNSVIRMSVPGNTIVFEGSLLGVVAVHSLRFVDDVGGCKVTERETYHGLTSPVMALLRTRQQRAFDTALANLKLKIEGVPRR
jgi:hypothetical protein